jgi:hypothetical protein
MMTYIEELQAQVRFLVARLEVAQTRAERAEAAAETYYHNGELAARERDAAIARAEQAEAALLAMRDRAYGAEAALLAAVQP